MAKKKTKKVDDAVDAARRKAYHRPIPAGNNPRLRIPIDFDALIRGQGKPLPVLLEMYKHYPQAQPVLAALVAEEALLENIDF
jgi:hypothetical protein